MYYGVQEFLWNHPSLKNCTSYLCSWRFGAQHTLHSSVEKAGDSPGGNREVTVMQQGRDLTDLCWCFVFISHVVTDELYNKISTDCRGCRNDPFMLGGGNINERGRGTRDKSHFSASHLSSVLVHAYKGKSSPPLSSALDHCGTEWRWPTWEEPFNISQPQGVPLHAILQVWPGRRGEVGLEVSLVPFPASCKDLRWPLPFVSWWALNWGIALGSHFTPSASTVPCLQRHLWEKLNLCLCKQVTEGEILLPCWRSHPNLHPNLPSCSIVLTSWWTPKHGDSFENKVAGIQGGILKRQCKSSSPSSSKQFICFQVTSLEVTTPFPWLQGRAKLH